MAEEVKAKTLEIIYFNTEVKKDNVYIVWFSDVLQAWTLVDTAKLADIEAFNG